MIQTNILSQLIIVLLFLNCIKQTELKAKNAQSALVDTKFNVQIPRIPTDFKVSAHLIYNDGKTSSFDVLNAKTKALWNTNIGAGDAERPSTSTRIRLTGKLDSLRVRVFNGKKKVVDQKLPNFSGTRQFIIKNTGCEIVKIYVTKNQKTIFKNNILFECGE